MFQIWKENKELIFVIDDTLKNEKIKNYKDMLSEIITIDDFINIRTIILKCIRIILKELFFSYFDLIFFLIYVKIEKKISNL